MAFREGLKNIFLCKLFLMKTIKLYIFKESLNIFFAVRKTKYQIDIVDFIKN